MKKKVIPEGRKAPVAMNEDKSNSMGDTIVVKMPDEEFSAPKEASKYAYYDEASAAKPSVQTRYSVSSSAVLAVCTSIKPSASIQPVEKSPAGHKGEERYMFLEREDVLSMIGCAAMWVLIERGNVATRLGGPVIIVSRLERSAITGVLKGGCVSTLAMNAKLYCVYCNAYGGPLGFRYLLGSHQVDQSDLKARRTACRYLRRQQVKSWMEQDAVGLTITTKKWVLEEARKEEKAKGGRVRKEKKNRGERRYAVMSAPSILLEIHQFPPT